MTCISKTFCLFPQKTKRHLTQRIEGLDGKLDEQKEMSGQIKQEVELFLVCLYYCMFADFCVCLLK